MRRSKTAQTLYNRHRWLYTKVQRRSPFDISLDEGLNLNHIKASINILPSEIEL